ncbi:DUF1801 domain-containing protein [Alkaliphilus serpentinus]|uniref:DUF1801 domain-containing protein n=1 Tax=Alkaliphilus serpentinus TaxID=1482731 RepID=A0A833HLR6_9FIRM|nr:DUF1801 domain-containing protein [Alkaliphilus serpentinus]KAB3526363.1 DUF1801 domain-containing protein [Alkaliphilus serpentinus]
MYQLKTKENNDPVIEFLNSIDNDKRRGDSFKVLEIMEIITKESPKMWGDKIVGFGKYHYQYASGQSGDWMRIAFSPRKGNLSIYIMDGFDKHKELLNKLGKHKTGKSCLYINKLEDIDLKTLEDLISDSWKNMNILYPM